MGRIHVVVSNAGYGLFGAAEELSDAQVDRVIATNVTGSIQLIRSALPHLRAQGDGRIVQISSYGGQVAIAGNSMYHATTWGIEGFVESVAQEVAPFGIGMTIVEPGGARTEFRYGSAQVAQLSPVYDGNPAHAFLAMLDPANGVAPGDLARMASCIIESVDVTQPVWASSRLARCVRCAATPAVRPLACPSALCGHARRGPCHPRGRARPQRRSLPS
jgi:NAD(P)-dependent dehydrogenase (short-subunit alcohol dehydrogenase family)